MDEVIKGQLEKFSHIFFGSFIHKPTVDLVKKLIKLFDEPQLKYCFFFFAYSGSVAVDGTLKFVYQSVLLSLDRKSKFLTIRKGHLGDTFCAMSVCNFVSTLNSFCGDYLQQNIFVDKLPVIEGLPYSSFAFKKISGTRNM